MKKLCLLLVLICIELVVSAQPDSTTFSNEQVLRVSNEIKTLAAKDSLNTLLITELKYQTTELKNYIKRDSLLLDFIALREKQVNLYLDLYKQTKPKWYDKKIVWFSLGMGSVIASSWVVANTIP